MNQQELDDLFRETLKNHSVPVSEFVWEKLSSEQSKRKPLFFLRNKRNLNVMVAIVVATCVGALSFNLLKKAGGMETGSNGSKASLKDKIILPTGSSSSTGHSSWIPKSTPDATGYFSAEVAGKKRKTGTFGEKSGNHIGSDEAIDQSESEVTVTNPIRYSQGDSGKSGKSLSGIANEKFDGLPKKVVNVQNDLSEMNPFQNINGNKKGSVIKGVAAIDIGNDVYRNKLDSLGLSSQAHEYGVTKGEHVFVSTPRWEPNCPTSFAVKSKSSFFKNPIQVSNSEPDIEKKWYLSAFASPDFNIKGIKISGKISDLFIHLNDSTHKINGGLTFGVKIGRSLGKHFWISSGLQFRQITEKFDYTYYDDSKSSIVSIQRSYKNDAGQTQYATENTSYLQAGYVQKSSLNTYNSIEVPLTLSYERSLGKFFFGVRSGAIATLSTQYQGQTIDTSLQVVPLGAKEANGFYKGKPALGMFGSLTLGFQISSSVVISVEPYGRYSLSNNNISTAGYEQKFSAAGVNIGARYYFQHKGNKEQ